MIELRSVYVKSQNPEDVISALCKLFENDDDMNGVNGKEYLWEAASAAGFETDLDYLVALASGHSELYVIIATFFHAVARYNGYYYSMLNWDYCTNENNEIVSISMAFDDCL